MATGNTKQREIAARQMARDWKEVAGSPAGINVLGNLLKLTTFSGAPDGGEHTHITAFQNGKRFVGDWVLAQICASAPEHASKIIMRGMSHESRERGDSPNSGFHDDCDD